MVRLSLALTRCCSACAEDKPLGAFGHHPAGLYRRRSICRACSSKRSAELNKANRKPPTDESRARQREYMRRRRAEDPDTSTKRRAYYERTRQRVLEVSAAYYAANRERVIRRGLEWERANPEKSAAKRHRRRAAMLGAPGECSPEQMAARIAVFGGKCWVPGCDQPGTAMDHVIPVSRGGANWPSNLRPICKSHNSRKSDTPWRDFLRKIGA